jgi:hypothetical protein
MRFEAKDVDVDAVKGYEAVFAKNGKVLGPLQVLRIFIVRSIRYSSMSESFTIFKIQVKKST